MMDKNGIDHTVMAPIPTIKLVKDGKGGYSPAEGKACCGCNYYIHDDEVRSARTVSADDYDRVCKESPGLSFDTGCDATNAAEYRKLSPAQKDRFDPMVTGLVLGTDNCADQLLRKLGAHPGVFTGVGEITVHKEFVQDLLPAGHQANVVPATKNTDGLRDLIKTCGHIGMPMVIHCDADVIPAKRDPGAEPRYFDHMKELLSTPECEHTTVIWAHAGGAGKYAHLRDDHVDRLDKMLSQQNLKNVNIDISWDVVADQICNRPVPDDKSGTKYVFDQHKADKWIKLFEKHPTRVVFGSDSLAPLSHEAWNSTAKQYEEMLSRLTPSTRDCIMRDNYKRLIVDARPRVRAWEKHCLPHSLQAINVRNDDPLNKREFDRVGAKARHGLLVGRVAVELEVAHGDENNGKVKDAVANVKLEARNEALRGGASEIEAIQIGNAAGRQALDSARQEIRPNDHNKPLLVSNL